MPIYEYACTACNHKMEVLQKMSDLPLERCPTCGQDTLKKLVSAAAFHLKGTGWYKTDFSGKHKPEKPEKPEKKEKTDTSASTACKTNASSTPASD